MARLDNTPDLDLLVGGWMDHKAAAEKHSNEARRLGTEIAEKVGAGNSYEVVDGVGVAVTNPRSTISEKGLDAALAAGAITSAQYAECFDMTPRFSADKARQALTGNQLDAIKTIGAPTVRGL